MENIALIGIDLGKNAFHIHYQNSQGKAVYRKKFIRTKLYEFLDDHRDGSLWWSSFHGTQTV